MNEAASIQEEVLYNVSKRTLGAQALFFPEHFGHSKEPSDLAWVANRCVILMYAKEGKGSYKKKKRHNLRQLSAWLRKWRAGQPLSGLVAGNRAEFALHDVDHVVALSIVGGEDKVDLLCEYHHDHVARFAERHKLSACATVTNAVIRELSSFVTGPRDVAFWLSTLSLQDGPVTEDELLQSIRRAKLIVQRESLALFNLTDADRDALLPAVQHSVVSLEALKSDATGWARGGDIGADLRFRESLWLALAPAAHRKIIGSSQHLVPIHEAQFGLYRLLWITCPSIGQWSKFVDKVTSLSRVPSVAVLDSMNAGRLMIFGERDGPSMLQQELAALKKQSLRIAKNL